MDVAVREIERRFAAGGASERELLDGLRRAGLPTHIELGGVGLSITTTAVTPSASVRDLGPLEQLRGLRSLDLSQAHPSVASDVAALEALLNASALRGLERLSLRYAPLGDAVADLLGSALPRLRHLDLGYTGLSDAGAERLADAPGGDLRALLLTATKLSAEGVAAICGAPRFAQLELLDLRCVSMGLDGARALAGSSFPRLTILRAHVDDLGGLEGAHLLATSDHLSRATQAHWQSKLGSLTA